MRPSKYIGNMPEQNIVHTTADRYDYVYAGIPAIDTNPSIPYATWLNTLTGEVFVCTNNEPGVNFWAGSNGGFVSVIHTTNLVFSLDGAYDSVGKNAVTPVGVVPTVSYRNFLGLNFDGATNYTRSVFPFDDSADYTISVHVRNTSVSGGSIFKPFIGSDQDAGNGNALIIACERGLPTTIHYAFGDGVQHSTPSVFTAGEFDHLALVREGNLGHLYINGTLHTGDIAIGTIVNSSSELWLGAAKYTPQSERQGDCDVCGLRIYNSALPSGTITALASEGV